MNLRWKRNGYRMQFQIVCAIASQNAPLSADERRVVTDTVKRIPQRPDINVESVNCGDRHLELLVTTGPGFDPAVLMKVVKTETAYQVGVQRQGDNKGLWTGGYVFVTIGSYIDADGAAGELQKRFGRAQS